MQRAREREYVYLEKALYEAIINGHSKTALDLIRMISEDQGAGAQLTARDKNGRNFVSLALEAGLDSVAEALLDNLLKAENDTLDALVAESDSHLTNIDELLDKLQPPNLEDEVKTKLQAKLASGKKNLAALENRLHHIQLLILGADSRKRTLFWYAARAGNCHFFARLMKITESKLPENEVYPAVMEPDLKGDTPLHAVLREADFPGRLAAENTVWRALQPHDQRLPLYEAFNAVLEEGYQQKLADDHGRRLEIVKLLIAKLAAEKNPVELINQPSADGKTYMLLACEVHFLAAITMLSSYGGDLAVHDNKGISPFSLLQKFSETDRLSIVGGSDQVIPNDPGYPYLYRQVNNRGTGIIYGLKQRIEDYQKDLNARQRVPASSRMLSNFAGGLILLCFLAVAHRIITSPKDDSDKCKLLNPTVAMILGLLADYFAAMLAVIFIALPLRNREAVVSGREFQRQQIANQLRRDVLGKLEVLAFQEKKDRQHHVLPISSLDLQHLQSLLKKLGKSTSISDTRNLTRDLYASLERLESAMNTLQMPLLLQQRAVLFQQGEKGDVVTEKPGAGLTHS